MTTLHEEQTYNSLTQVGEEGSAEEEGSEDEAKVTTQPPTTQHQPLKFLEIDSVINFLCILFYCSLHKNKIKRM